LLKIIHAIPPLSAPSLKNSLALALRLLTSTTVLFVIEAAYERSYLSIPLGKHPHGGEELFTPFSGHDWKQGL
jgi:hypothetical protein